METKVSGVLTVTAVLAMVLFASAQAEEPQDGANFIKAVSPLESGSLVETRSGVGVDEAGEADQERRRRLSEQPTGSLSGAATALTRPVTLPITGSASRATDVQLSPAFVTAVRNEMQRLGVLK